MGRLIKKKRDSVKVLTFKELYDNCSHSVVETHQETGFCKNCGCLMMWDGDNYISHKEIYRG